jgi:hypothetical protein
MWWQRVNQDNLPDGLVVNPGINVGMTTIASGTVIVRRHALFA